MKAVRAEPFSESPAQPVASGQAHYGWLIVTALLIAGTIAAYLAYAPR